MLCKKWCNGLVATMAAGMLILAAAPVMSGVTPGDPDGDGVPTFMDAEPLVGDADYDGLADGAEQFVTGTDPAVANDAAADQLDGMVDLDTGGQSSGREIANGGNILNASDDILFSPPQITGPLPAPPDFTPVQTDYLQPLDFSWNNGPYTKFYLEFDKSPKFENPVTEIWDLAPASNKAPMATPTAATWKLVTRLGRVVYWRVVGEDAAMVRHSSMIASFVITGGPFNLNDADDAPAGPTVAPLPRPQFTWAPHPAMTGGYRVYFTGSHQLGTKVLVSPKTGWMTGTIYTPVLKKWKKITALGNTITWWVVGRDGSKRWAYSMPNELVIDGGATNLNTSGGPGPDSGLTFTADAGTATNYKILFSSSEDFSKPGFAYPKKGFKKITGPISFTPGPIQWRKINRLGRMVYWTVKGKEGKKYVTYSDIASINLGGYMNGMVEEGAGATALQMASANSVGSAYPTFNAVLQDPAAGGVEPALVETTGYRLIFSADRRMAGPTTTVPLNTYSDTAAIGLHQNASGRIAALGSPNVYLFIEGQSAAGNSFFSPPYLLTTGYLAPPTLDPLGASVRAGTAFNVDWSPSPVNAPADVLFWQVQESTSETFTTGINYYRVDVATSVMEVNKKPARDTTYYYRVQAVNAVGHSAWSNSRRKVVTGKSIKVKVTGTQPFEDGGNNIMVDDRKASRGSCVFEGPGWVDVCYDDPGEHICGRGYAGSYHYISVGYANPNGKEKVTWTPNIQKAGRYEVWVSWFGTENRDSHVEYFVNSAEGQFGPFVVDQTDYDRTTTWGRLGVYYFEEGKNGNVVLDWTSKGHSHSESADAAGFRYVGP